MKLFLVASIHGKSKYEESYKAIAETAASTGNSLVADHILNVTAEELDSWDHEKDLEFHKRVVDGIKKSDIVLAELSYPSVSVGYLVSLAVESGVPTIGLYMGNEEPHLLPTLAENEKFQLINYKNLDELRTELPSAIEYATGQQDTRFNFFIAPKHQNYLDWISKNKKIPRAVYLRRLIERDMDKNTEYEK